MPYTQLVPPRSQLSSKSVSVQIRGDLRANLKEISRLTINTQPACPSTNAGYRGDADPFCAEGKNKAGLAGKRHVTAKEVQGHCHKATRSCSAALLHTRGWPFTYSNITGIWARY